MWTQEHKPDFAHVFGRGQRLGGAADCDLRGLVDGIAKAPVDIAGNAIEVALTHQPPATTPDGSGPRFALPRAFPRSRKVPRCG